VEEWRVKRNSRQGKEERGKLKRWIDLSVYVVDVSCRIFVSPLLSFILNLIALPNGKQTQFHDFES
jgi:hypothetical protein